MEKVFIKLDSLRDMKEGDVIRHVSGGPAYIVTANYGTRVTAVLTKDVTNPNEWEKLVTVKEVSPQ
jgi:hypothetical protein